MIFSFFFFEIRVSIARNISLGKKKVIILNKCWAMKKIIYNFCIRKKYIVAGAYSSETGLVWNKLNGNDFFPSSLQSKTVSEKLYQINRNSFTYRINAPVTQFFDQTNDSVSHLFRLNSINLNTFKRPSCIWKPTYIMMYFVY